MRLSPTLLFALRFVVFYAVLMGGFEAARGSALERTVVEQGLLVPATWLADRLDRHPPVYLAGRTIASATSQLRVVRGCEGIETVLLWIAAVCAYPVAWARRAPALAAGTALAWLLSLLRLLALHFTLRYSPQAWELLHGLVLPLAPVLAITLYFLHWSDAQGAKPSPDAVRFGDAR